MTISGLTPNQFDDLLSPVYTMNGAREVTLFFRRFVHLITHGEWLNDASLIDRYYQHIKNGGQTDTKTQYVFQQILIRTHLNGSSKDKIEELIKHQEPYTYIHSRFTMDMWYSAHTGCASITDEQIENNTVNLTDEEKKEFRALALAFKNDHTDASQDKLNAWMLALEKTEMDSFRQLLDSTLSNIYKGQSTSSDLKVDVRYIRQYLISHGHFNFNTKNVDDPGPASEVKYGLSKLADPNFKALGNEGTVVVRNNRLSVQVRKNGVTSPHWIAGFNISDKGHIWPYVFDGEKYVCLDNQKITYTDPTIYFYEARNIARGDLIKVGRHRSFTAQELMDSTFKDQLLKDDIYLLPETFEPVEYPDPANWTVPKWERNNCFIASSLVLLALHQFYKEQAK